MFSLFNFSSIFRGGQLTTFAPICGRPCMKLRPIWPHQLWCLTWCVVGLWWPTVNEQDCSLPFTFNGRLYEQCAQTVHDVNGPCDQFACFLPGHDWAYCIPPNRTGNYAVVLLTYYPEMNWTDLTCTGRPSYTTRSLATRLSVYTILRFDWL